MRNEEWGGGPRPLNLEKFSEETASGEIAPFLVQGPPRTRIFGRESRRSTIHINIVKENFEPQPTRLSLHSLEPLGPGRLGRQGPLDLAILDSHLQGKRTRTNRIPLRRTRDRLS